MLRLAVFRVCLSGQRFCISNINMYEGAEWILEESEKHVKSHSADMLAVIVIDIDRCSCLPRGTIVRNA